MLPAATFEAHEAAERIGLPPLAADGGILLHAIHAETAKVWAANALAPLDLLSTLVNDGAARAVNAHPGDPAVPMHCTSGQIVTAMGVLRGEPRTLAIQRAQFLAQYILGSLISKVEPDGPNAPMYPRRKVSFMRGGTMGQNEAAMPAISQGNEPFSISCFIQDAGTAQGSIDRGDVSLPWQYSNGALGLKSADALKALGVNAGWARIAVGAAMSVSTSMVAA